MFLPSDHTFMICAYKENPYLEECILSILNQTIKSNICISTSTPNDYIKLLAHKYKLSIVINEGLGNQVDNLNFAFQKAKTKLVTLCHQDDYYFPEYLKNILDYANRAKSPIVLFSDYCEVRVDTYIKTNKLLRIKRIMNAPLSFSPIWRSRWVRRRILSIGNSICCPSVTFCKNMVLDPPFSYEYENDLDWDAWERLSSMEGAFIYIPSQLMAHRIWEGSETSKNIADSTRRNEDYKIFRRFWPEPIARFLLHFYLKSEKSNDME